MTIALGILASDGVVIAADSQETVQGYWKTNQGKITWSGFYGELRKTRGRSAGVCAIAGAGNRAGYVDALTSRLTAAFNGDPDAVQRGDVQSLFEAETLTFHREHVVPYSDLPEVSLVIGYYRNHHEALFTTDRGALIRQNSFGAVGIGAMEAQSMLRFIWKLRPDVRTAIVLAAYAVFLAKEKVDGCGSFTDVVYLRNHEAKGVPRETIERLEQVFRRYAKYLEMPLLHRVLGAEQTKPMSNAGEMAEVLRRDIAGVDITLTEGLVGFDPTESRVPPHPKRDRKGRSPSQA
jgi:hypothetical protein